VKAFTLYLFIPGDDYFMQFRYLLLTFIIGGQVDPG
jgi:hypothetical protein